MKLSLISSVSVLVLGTACIGPQQTLAPAPSAPLAAESHGAVVDEDNGIRGVAQVEAWDGEVVLKDVVTPIRVILKNQSDRAVFVRLEDFSLVGDSGRQYRALKPAAIAGTAPMLRAVPDDIPKDSSVGLSQFDTTTGRAPAYPSIYTSGQPFPSHAGTPTTAERTRGAVDLPTPYMLSAAIEEGKLVKGDEDVGFVYFEPLSETEAGFELRVNLEAESPQANSANLRFPFVVKG